MINGTPLQYSCLENPMDGGAWWAAVHGVARSQTWLSNFTLTFHFYALEEEMATHSSVLAWRISWTEEPGGLLSMGSHRVGHDWSDLAAVAAAAYNLPFPSWASLPLLSISFAKLFFFLPYKDSQFELGQWWARRCEGCFQLIYLKSSRTYAYKGGNAKSKVLTKYKNAYLDL